MWILFFFSSSFFLVKFHWQFPINQMSIPTWFQCLYCLMPFCQLFVFLVYLVWPLAILICNTFWSTHVCCYLTSHVMARVWTPCWAWGLNKGRACCVFTGLARLPLVNTYARTPPIVWRLGWSPSPTGTHRTQLPPLPVEFLQEKDVLKEFVTRINTRGMLWTGLRQLFNKSGNVVNRVDTGWNTFGYVVNLVDTV